MQLNITTDYAIRLLLYLATVDRTAPSREVAREMNIPPKYITTIVAKLKEKAYIQTFQGVGGGYALACSPSDITLRDIVETMEGSLKINRCTSCDPHCSLYTNDSCPLSNAYDGIQKTLKNVLESMTIQDLIHKK